MDEILREVRRIREDLAARFNYDISAIHAYLTMMQKNRRESAAAFRDASGSTEAFAKCESDSLQCSPGLTSAEAEIVIDGTPLRRQGSVLVYAGVTNRAVEDPVAELREERMRTLSGQAAGNRKDC